MFGLAPAPLGAQTVPRTAADDEHRIDRQLISSSVDEFASELDGARESFLNVDGRTAALRIRRAIARMQGRTKDAAEASRELINRSATELESLAKAIEERRLASVRPLDEAFARANYALAQNHLLLAMRAQNQQARERLGQNLRQDEQEFVQNTRKLAGNLTHGIGTTTDEIKHGIQSLGQRLEQVQAADSASQTTQTPKSALVR